MLVSMYQIQIKKEKPHEAAVERFTEEAYREQRDEWETALNHYLRTGKRLER